jgi:hypothetical protein
MAIMQTTTISKTELLHRIAKEYVVKGLAEKNFDAIPYDANVSLRAPLCPGGSEVPLHGKENLRQQWWTPLPSLLGKVTFIESFVNKDQTGVAAEFHCEILHPSCTLRVIDRFKINDDGKITEQENFFDPGKVIHPETGGV